MKSRKYVLKTFELYTEVHFNITSLGFAISTTIHPDFYCIMVCFHVTFYVIIIEHVYLKCLMNESNVDDNLLLTAVKLH
jgi:hypothetical protein